MRPAQRRHDHDDYHRRDAAADGTVRHRHRGARHRGRTIRDAEQPPHRRPRTPQHPHRGATPHAGHDRTHRPDHGDQPDDRGDERVRHDRDQAHPSRQRDHQRHGDNERGRRHRDDLRGSTPPTARPQPIRPARCEQDEARRGEHRQCESRAHGQLRCDGEQSDHGRAQCGERLFSPAGEQCQHRHRTHRRRAQHARVGARDHHEQRDHHRGRRGTGPWTGGEQPGER